MVRLRTRTLIMILVLSGVGMGFLTDYIGQGLGFLMGIWWTMLMYRLPYFAD